ncbi:MAG: glycosyltransferase family 4 protein [Candidatus Moranbacteria bacterium]|nr:glycosyltransferase family 4 protein [Candidatus Moranbacteria bacterium]
MRKIIFIANNNIGHGLSGGDRIFIELGKDWQSKINITFVGSEEAIIISQSRGLRNIRFIEADQKKGYENIDSFWKSTKHVFSRTQKGVRCLKNNPDELKSAEYVYSASDFWPDLWLAFWLKRKTPKTIWLAGFYLFAPSPFSQNSPYKNSQRLKGFFYWLSQKPAYWIVKKYADFVFVTSEPDIQKFITRKRDKNKIIVVRGGVDISESEKYLQSGQIIPAPGRKYDACFVGRFHPQKGVLELIDIWRRVVEKCKNAKLAMIGNGPLEQQIRDRIKKYDLENNIDLLGFCDGEEKYEIFKNSKIILHPAVYDSGGMSAAEGMAWELPAVSFDLPALKSYYPKGMLKAECSNIGEFAKNILRLLNDSDLYEKTACEALNFIREEWDWQKRAEEIFDQVF